MSTFSQFFSINNGGNGNGTGGNSNSNTVSDAVFLNSELETVGKNGIVYLRSGLVKSANDFPDAPLINKTGNLWVYNDSTYENSSETIADVFDLNGRCFITAAYNSTPACFSTLDGKTWTEHRVPGFSFSKALAFMGSLYIAITGNELLYSTENDWSNSSKITLPNVGSGYVSCAGSKYQSQDLMTFVAIAENTASAIHSPDGLNWSVVTLPGALPWTKVVYGNGMFIAISSNSTNKVAKSLDGITWSFVEMALTDVWKDIQFTSDERFVIYSDKHLCMTADFNPVEIDKRPTPSGFEIISVGISGNVNVVIGKKGKSLITTDDFYSFRETSYTFPDPYSTPRLGGCVYVNGNLNGFVVVSDKQCTFTSNKSIGSTKYTPNLYFKVGTYDVDDDAGPYYDSRNSGI